MKTVILLALVSLAASFPEHLFPKRAEGAQGNDWGVLVAGSNGWGNYRHQVRQEICFKQKIIMRADHATITNALALYSFLILKIVFSF